LDYNYDCRLEKFCRLKEPRAGFDPATNSLQGSLRKRQPFDCRSTMKDFKDFLAVDLRLEERTVMVHYNNVRRFFNSVPKNPSEVTKLDIRGYLQKRMNSKSISTTNNDLKSFKRFFRDYLERPEVVKGFRFPQSPFKPKIVLSKNELGLAYRTISSDLGRAVFLFYASTGLRRSEVLGLAVDEVDFKKRMVIPDCHNGRSKHSYVSFYNEETEKWLRKYW